MQAHPGMLSAASGHRQTAVHPHLKQPSSVGQRGIWTTPDGLTGVLQGSAHAAETTEASALCWRQAMHWRGSCLTLSRLCHKDLASLIFAQHRHNVHGMPLPPRSILLFCSNQGLMHCLMQLQSLAAAEGEAQGARTAKSLKAGPLLWPQTAPEQRLRRRWARPWRCHS